MWKKKEESIFIVKKGIVITVAVICLLTAMAFATIDLNNTNLRSCVKDFVYGRNARMEEMHFASDEIKTQGYMIENEEYVCKNDAKFVIDDINDYVQTVTIKLEKVFDADTDVRIYYGATPEEDETVFAHNTFLKNEEQMTFMLQRNISQLRFTIGGDGDRVVLEEVSVNQSAVRFSIRRLLRCIIKIVCSGWWCNRAIIFTIVLFFIALHFMVDKRKMYGWLFDKRWQLAGIILLFMVINRYNGDSLAIYDNYIQPGLGNEYVQPIVGKARAIRSDEWMVSTPLRLSTQFLDNPYGKYNTIVRGTKTINENRLSVMTLAYPVSWIEIAITEVFGVDYGLSFRWYFSIIFTFLIHIELFLIITKKNKLLSGCGAAMVFFSSFYLWWGFPAILMYAPAALVCAWHFVYQKKWKDKIILAWGTAYFTAAFVNLLYPAWQVPMAYIVLVILVWMIHESWDKLKSLSKQECLTMGIAFVFCLVLIAAYLLGQREYMEIITQTEYPGSRVDYGSFSIGKLFNYIPAVLFAYKDVENASEAGTCISLFPLPMIAAAYFWLKSKKKNWLVTGLMAVALYLTIYTTIGLPPVLAKLSLMVFSTSFRAVDLLGYLQVILFVVVMTEYGDEFRIKKQKNATLISVAAGIVLVVLANHFLPHYMGKLYMLVAMFVLAFICYALFGNASSKYTERALCMIIVVAVLTGAYVRPIAKGTDAIYSKPAAKKIMEIVKEDKEAKWITCDSSIALQSFAVACGAPTINSVNTYPNMELWRILDSTGKYNKVYNRYAHVNVALTDKDTNFKLIQKDWMQLNLSYKDIEKTGAKYIFATTHLRDTNVYVDFEEIYAEAGSYIYQINY